MNVNQFDGWLTSMDSVAVIVQEALEPVLGADSVFFPPTFAPAEGSKDTPSYAIDQAPNEKAVALVDTLGSQANRMEPLFKQEPYSQLVPRARVKVGEREVDLLDAGHRAADALVRFSEKAADLKQAFVSIRDRGDATALARLAPTSLVFGVWDSRDTQVKLPRLVGSTVRAHDVVKFNRSAQYFSSLEKEETEDLGSQDFLSEQGLSDAPAGRTHGGIQARGGIRREAVLNLVALRALASSSEPETLKLRRYILGLSLVALLTPMELFLREGCLLVPAQEGSSGVNMVERSGKRTPVNINPDEALGYALAAAKDFGVGPAWTAAFSRARIAEKESAKKTKGPKAKS